MKHRMKSNYKGLKRGRLHSLIVAVLAALLLLPGCGGSKGVEEKKETLNFYSDVKSVNKLVLAQMAITKMATINDANRNNTGTGLQGTMDKVVNSMKIGTRKAAYSYQTYLRAYVDLSSLTPEDVKVDEKEKVVTIKLPPIKTEFVGRDMDITEEHYRVTGLRSQITAEERARAKEKMNASLKNEVKNNAAFVQKLEETAQAKARTYFQTMFQPQGYNVVVEFKK